MQFLFRLNLEEAAEVYTIFTQLEVMYFCKNRPDKYRSIDSACLQKLKGKTSKALKVHDYKRLMALLHQSL